MVQLNEGEGQDGLDLGMFQNTASPPALLEGVSQTQVYKRQEGILFGNEISLPGSLGCFWKPTQMNFLCSINYNTMTSGVVSPFTIENQTKTNKNKESHPGCSWAVFL